MLDGAESDEDLAAVEALWAEATGADLTPRIVTQEQAAKALGCVRSRLREMERSAKWWKPHFRTEAGYAIDEIVKAQAAYHGETTSEDPGWREREQAARAMLLEQKQRAAELEWQKRQGNVLPADVYQEFIRELLGMIHGALAGIPEDLADEVPPEVQKYFYVPPDQQRSPADQAPLQRAIARLIAEIEQWLTEDPAEEAATK